MLKDLVLTWSELPNAGVRLYDICIFCYDHHIRLGDHSAINALCHRHKTGKQV